MIMSRRPKFLQKNLDFGGHQKIFGTDITRKYLTRTKAKHFESKKKYASADQPLPHVRLYNRISEIGFYSPKKSDFIQEENWIFFI